ncbi:MAG: thiamine-binding protein [Acidimicrobiia bacterium]|nr:thiamine-binding protein [Acidimicrobiia bacterium]
MSDVRMEILVEPFKENDPGPHVTAVVDAARATGLDVDMGPFATSVSGDLDELVAASSAMLRAGFEAGATAIQLRVET